MSNAHYDTRNRQVRWIIYFVLIVSIALLAYLSLKYSGRVTFTFGELYLTLLGQTDNLMQYTFWHLRFPRVLIAMTAGMTFGMGGAVFQKQLQNPLATPEILGISTGASFAVIWSMTILHWNGTPLMILATLSGILVAVLIYLLTCFMNYTGEKLILLGIGVQFFFNALIAFLLQKSNQNDLMIYYQWAMGSLSNHSLDDFKDILPIHLICIMLILLLASDINTLQFGNEYPQSLGVYVKFVRLASLLVAVVMTSSSVALTGPIASIAFLSGTISQTIVGSGRNNFLVSGLVGALLLIATDLIGRTLLPIQVPVGILTGVMGVPYMLYIFIRNSSRGAK